VKINFKGHKPKLLEGYLDASRCDLFVAKKHHPQTNRFLTILANVSINNSLYYPVRGK